MERSEYCAKELFDIIRNSCTETYSFFLTTSERIELIKACIDIRFFFDWNFKFQDFYEVIASYHYPPLEFLWNINILQIMPLDTYIFKIHTNTEILQKFKESVNRLCIQDFEESDAQYLVQTGMLSYFVLKAFPVADSVSWDARIKEVCLETVISLLQAIFSTGEKEARAKRFTCFFSLWNAGLLEEECLINFSSYALDYYLNLFPSVNELEAFAILEKSCSGSAPYHLLNVIEKLLAPQKPDEITQILTTATQNAETNASSLLTTLRTYCKVYKEASVFLSKLASELMSKAYEKFSYSMLMRSLFIGRQAAFQPNIPSHINYKQWLQAVFTECHRPRNSRSFYLLIQVLSDIVPYYKSIECLKVAIDINVSLPPEVQNTYADYIILLKTRVQDLEPQSKPEEMVEKILSLFESLGKIPPVVLEMSLLQKHKFLNEFLPALLVPRVVPQIPDMKERFIQTLDKAGKIPSNILQRYRTGCQEQKVPTDIDIINESFDEFLNENMDEL